jgi:hypothetical protein
MLALPALAVPPPAPTSKPATATAPATKAAVDLSLVPKDKDEYAGFVERAESGATDIDFLAMRHAYLKSEAFLRAGGAFETLAKLRKQMFADMDKGDAKAVQDSARKILAIVYIDLDAQKAMKDSCKLLGDAACEAHFRYTELGLLESIVRTGDGSSCDTAWEVVSVDEEYFILNALGFELETQGGPGNGGMCDTMTGKQKGQPATYYFGVEKVFEGYQRKFGPGKG